MKLKKILSGFLAAAMAVTTMVTATFNAGAAEDPKSYVTVKGNTRDWALNISFTPKTMIQVGTNTYDLAFTNENSYDDSFAAGVDDDGNPKKAAIAINFMDVDKRLSDMSLLSVSVDGVDKDVSSSDVTPKSWLYDEETKASIEVAYSIILTDEQLEKIGAIPKNSTVTFKVQATYDATPVGGSKWTKKAAGEYKFISAAKPDGVADDVYGSGDICPDEELVDLNDLLPTGKTLADIRKIKITASVGPWQVFNGAIGTNIVTANEPTDGEWASAKCEVSGTADPSTTLVAEFEAPLGVADGQKLKLQSHHMNYSTTVDVKIEVEVAHDIDIADDIEHGTVTADKEKAAKNEKVTLTVEPDAGYELDEIIVSTSTAGTDTITVAADNTFTMPDKAVTVTATFKKQEYTITNTTTDTNGTVTIKNADGEAVTKAAEGDKITITAAGKTGYELDTLKVNGTAVTAAEDGTYTHTMTAANTTVEATFKLKEVPLESITLDKTAAVLVGGTKKLSAAKVPSTTTDKTAITWTSSDETVATVASDGTVNGLKAGTATITAACGDIKATCAVTVTAEAKPCTSVTLDQTTAEVAKGKTVTLKATTLPEDTTDDITWTTSDSAVATVKGGVVTAVAAGTATITVKCGEQTAECKVTVPSDACTSVTLDKTEATILKGATVTLKATALPEGTPDTITWTTSDASVATVADGVVTGVSRGVATITVKCGEKTATCKVSVNEEETVSIPADPSKPANQFRSAVTSGKYNENDVFVLSADDVKTAKSVTVTVTDSNGKKTTKDVTECYKKVTYTAANGTTDTITAGANYLLAVTVTGIPDGTTVTVSIAVNK